MMIFSNFSAKANAVVEEAVSAAAKLGHGYVGTEHLLLGLCRADDTAAKYALDKSGITAEAVEEQIVEDIGRGIKGNVSVQDMTPRTKRVLHFRSQGKRLESDGYNPFGGRGTQRNSRGYA